MMPCVYPEPPNRRLLAARRSGRDVSAQKEDMLPSTEPIRAEHTSDSNTDDMPFAELLSPAGTTPFPLPSELLPISPIPEVVAQVSGDFTDNPHNYGISQDQRRLPEREIGLLLIEVYFSRVFSASLLYNHKEFVECYCAGTLPKHVLLSTFAISSLCV
jgi:hypothetical protein